MEYLLFCPTHQMSQLCSTVLKNLAVTQQAGERLVIVKTDDTEMPEIIRNAGLIDLTGKAVDLPLNLTAEEQLFISAWRLQKAKKTDRVGDGLSWGDPEFEPP